MPSEFEKLIVTFEANNAALLKKIDQNNKSLKVFEGKTNRALEKVDKAFIRTGNVASISGKKMSRSMKGAAGQIGFQVQDIAVQLAAGQNAMLVFAQQGSQIASIFGPGGAMVGALLAVSGALGGALIPQLLSAKNAAEELDEIFNELGKTLSKSESGVFEFTKEFKALAKKNKDVALIRLKREEIRALEAGKLAVKGLKEELGEISGLSNKLDLPIQSLGEIIRLLNKPIITKEDLIAVSGALNKIGLSSKNASPELIRLADDANTAVLRIQDLDQALLKLNSASKSLDFASITDLEGITKQRLSLIKKMVRASSAELDEFLGKVKNQEQAEAAFNRSIEGALAQAFPDKAKIQGLREQILTLQVAAEDAFNEGNFEDVKKFEGGIAALEKQVSGVGKEMIKLDDEALSKIQGSFEDFFADMDAGFEGLGDAFLGMINQMIAESLSADLMNALFGKKGKDGSRGGGLLGDGSLSGLLDTILPSADGGGFTGNAPRSGGLDGKGGFLAMMHPQEIVTDLHGSAVNQSSGSGNGDVQVAVLNDPESILEVMRSPAGRKAFVEVTRKDARAISRNLSRTT